MGHISESQNLIVNVAKYATLVALLTLLKKFLYLFQGLYSFLEKFRTILVVDSRFLKIFFQAFRGLRAFQRPKNINFCLCPAF